MRLNPRYRPFLVILAATALAYLALAIIAPLRRARIVEEDTGRYVSILRQYLGEGRGQPASQVFPAGNAPPELTSPEVYDNFYRTPLLLLINGPDPDPELCRLVLGCETRRLPMSAILAPDPDYQSLFLRLTRVCVTDDATLSTRNSAAWCNMVSGNLATARELWSGICAEWEMEGGSDWCDAELLLRCRIMGHLFNGEVDEVIAIAREQWEASPMDEYLGSDLVKTAMRTGRYEQAAELLAEVNDFYKRCGANGLPDRYLLHGQIMRDSGDNAAYFAYLAQQCSRYLPGYRDRLKALVFLAEAGHPLPAELTGFLSTEHPPTGGPAMPGLVEAYALTGDPQLLDPLHNELLGQYQDYLDSHDAVITQVNPHDYEITVNGRTIQHSELYISPQGNQEEEILNKFLYRRLNSLRTAVSYYLDACQQRGDWDAVDRAGVRKIMNLVAEAPDPARRAQLRQYFRTDNLSYQTGLLLKRVACREPILQWDLGYEEYGDLVESGELAWVLNMPGFTAAAEYAGVTVEQARRRVLRELGLGGDH